jgi:hypothetical protein
MSCIDQLNQARDKVMRSRPTGPLFASDLLFQTPLKTSRKGVLSGRGLCATRLLRPTGEQGW